MTESYLIQLDEFLLSNWQCFQKTWSWLQRFLI